MAGSALFIPAVLAAALVLTGCGDQSRSTVSIDPALAGLVSPDAWVLGGIDVDSVKQTAFYKRHESLLDNPLITGLTNRTAFDPRRQISRVILTWNGRDLVVIARGDFSKDLVERQLATNTPHMSYQKYSLFNSGRNIVALPAAGMIVAGSEHAVRSTLDLRDKHTGQVSPQFSSVLAQLSKAEQIWLVSRGRLPFADLPTRSDQVSLLSNFSGYVASTSAGITIDSGLYFKAQIDCASPPGARRVSDGLRAAIGLLRLNTKQDAPDLLQLYNAVRIRQEGYSVFLEADVSPALADSLLVRLLTPRA